LLLPASVFVSLLLLPLLPHFGLAPRQLGGLGRRQGAERRQSAADRGVLCAVASATARGSAPTYVNVCALLLTAWLFDQRLRRHGRAQIFW
jgi:hypothetical protein